MSIRPGFTPRVCDTPYLEAQRERQCGTKRQYRSRAAAKRMRQRIQMRGKMDVPLNIYECNFCGYWHLGGNHLIFVQREDEAA